MKPSKDSYQPSHPGLFEVQFNCGEFSSFLTAKKDFQAGVKITRLEGLTRGPKAYTSVQCGPGPGDHVELNSDLVYVNHSCDPNVAFDLSSKDRDSWHVRAMKDICAGDALTFFYPSTEWDMDQAFDCQCGADSCLGRIQGAKYLSRAQLRERGFINEWIWTQHDSLDRENSPRLRERSKEEDDAASRCADCGYGFAVGGEAQRCGCPPKAEKSPNAQHGAIRP